LEHFCDRIISGFLSPFCHFTAIQQTKYMRPILCYSRYSRNLAKRMRPLPLLRVVEEQAKCFYEAKHFQCEAHYQNISLKNWNFLYPSLQTVV
jgi:hypothetical protein